MKITIELRNTAAERFSANPGAERFDFEFTGHTASAMRLR
jgi:hypothetical protein